MHNIVWNYGRQTIFKKENNMFIMFAAISCDKNSADVR